METRSMTEVRMYKLVLNDMRFDHIEDSKIVAVSFDYEKLVEWYNSQIAPALWRDGRWGKTFAQNTPLEWCNPASSLELNNLYQFGHGISDEWVREEYIGRIISEYTFID